MEKEKGFMNGSVPSWSCSSFGVEMKSNELNCVSEEIPNCFFSPNWENSMDQSDPFESALSSIVSSPVTVTSNAVNVINPAWAGDGEPLMIRELIGRLGNICNSREISPSNSYMNNNNNNNSSTNASCYSTPMSSPPKLSILGNHSTFAADPGFAERAARFSCFSSLNGHFGVNKSELTNSLIMPKLGSQPGKEKSNYDKRGAENAEIGDCREESSVSEQIPGGELSKKVEQNDSNSRKRKAIPRGKAKETPFSASQTKVSAEKDESNVKRSKSDEEANGKEEENGNQNQKQNKEKENSNAAEPPKDYIHVRARRGQATDSHSLAERVRREKISERMKFLQDLVPGCNKVTGKAVMLDEIINYVQSLQSQVEFLSMKLATVNPRMDVNMEALLSNSKDLFQGRGSLAHSVYQLPYSYQSQQGISSNAQTHFSINPLNAFDGFADSTAAPLVSAFWEDDLQSIVQMGFGQNQQQGFHGSVPGAHMKVEL